MHNVRAQHERSPAIAVLERTSRTRMSSYVTPWSALLAAAIAAVSFTLLDTATALISVLLGGTMLAIAVSDFRRFIVPDVLSLPAIPAGLIANAWLFAAEGEHATTILHGVVAAAAGFASLYALRWLYARLRQREGLGLGDVKLAAVAGSWNGLDGLGPTLLVACVLAIAFVLASQWSEGNGSKRMTATTAIPFGTFLAPSIWIVWIAGRL